MADYTQLMDAARRADAAGDAAGAKRFLELARGQSPQPSLLNRAASVASSAMEPLNAPVVQQAGVGTQEGIANIFGFPVDAMTAGLNFIGDKTGLYGPIENPIGGSESLMGLMAPFNDHVAEPQTGPERIARRIGREVGESASVALPMLGLGRVAKAKPSILPEGVWANPAGFAATELASGAGAGLGAGVANEIAPDSTMAEIAGLLLGGAAGAYGVGRRYDVTPDEQLRAQDRSVDTLKDEAGGLYTAARSGGRFAPQADAEAMFGNIETLARQAGVVSPSGRIAESYPRIKDALATVGDYSKGDMTVDNMQAVRRTLQDAAASTDRAEARIGRQMLREFDNFADNVAPELKEANALYRRAMLGEMADKTEDLAELRAETYSQSGLENARRIEARALDRQVTKGQLKGLTPDQIEALQRVSRGGAVENAFRGVGKAAPSGVVSLMASGGMPYLIGNTIGGPVAGALASAATMGAGTIGKAGAESMSKRNMERLAMLLRSETGKLPTRRDSGLEDIAMALLSTNILRDINEENE